jgi:hypothetical protein
MSSIDWNTFIFRHFSQWGTLLNRKGASMIGAVLSHVAIQAEK